jgi:putative membrane protein
MGSGGVHTVASKHETPHVGIPIQDNSFLRELVLIYVGVWMLGAMAPVDRSTWLLENLLVFAAVAVLIATHQRFVFSNLSYGLIIAFLGLHVVGSHYTYSEVPLSGRVASVFDLDRNHYDRLVHFAFGLMIAYPLREIGLRTLHVHRGWSYVVPVIATLALSSFYEILEFWAARLTSPETGIAFVGAQGDVWDGQKDMALALAGACIAMGLTWAWRKRTGCEPWFGPRVRRTDA